MADGFASLTSGLLARKGQARPAMRPQGFGGPAGNLEDLGWNDMGHDAPRPLGVRLPNHLSGPQAVPVEVPAVVRQQEELAAAVEAAPVETPVAAVPEPVAPAVAVAAEPEPPVAAPAPKPAKPRAKKAEPVAAVRNDGRKAAFTLRLDAERHLRLRLACAVSNRSAQQIVTQALDALLGDMPDIDRLAQSLPVAKN